MIPRINVEDAWLLPQLALRHSATVSRISAHAGPGLLECFRVSWPRPHRDRVLYVFPYADPSWHKAVSAVFEFERRAWKAFWWWTTTLEPGELQVLPFVTLLEDAEQACQCLDLKFCDGPALPALLRPMIDWPPIEHTLKSDEAKRWLDGSGWIGLRGLLQTVWKRAGEPESTLDLDQIEILKPWHLLSDGTHILPTQFRLFHSEHRKLAPW